MDDANPIYTPSDNTLADPKGYSINRVRQSNIKHTPPQQQQNHTQLLHFISRDVARIDISTSHQSNYVLHIIRNLFLLR